MLCSFDNSYFIIDTIIAIMDSSKERKCMTDYKYLTCRNCGKQWNVSKYNKDGSAYLCPKCRPSKKR